MKTSRAALLAATLLAVCGASPAVAVPVSYEFSGRAWSLGWSLGTPRPFDGISPFGHTATGSFTFDLDYSRVGYSSPEAMFGLATSSAFGNFNLSMSTFPSIGTFGSAGSDCNHQYSYFRIADGEAGAAMPFTSQPADQFMLSLYCEQQIAAGVTATSSFFFELLDWDGPLNMVNGLDPTQPLDWSSANEARFAFGYSLLDTNCTSCEFGIRESWTLGFDLESLSSTRSVPDPGTSTLLGIGLLMAAAARRRRTARGQP